MLQCVRIKLTLKCHKFSYSSFKCLFCQSKSWFILQIESVMDDLAHNKIDTWFTFNEWSEWACVSDGISRRERTCDYDQCVSVDSNGVVSISDTEEQSDPSCSSSIHHGKTLSLLSFTALLFAHAQWLLEGKHNF